MADRGWDREKMRDYLCSLLTLTPDSVVLDVGCGDGADLTQIGRRVGAQARLFGLDASEAAIEAARKAAAGDPRFGYRVCDLATGIPFADGMCDVVYSNNVLECLPDKRAFLVETHRVLRPDGQVVCAHWDWDTQTIDGDDKALVRKVVHEFSDWKQAWMADADGWMGRRLWRTFQAGGLFRGSVRTYTLTNTEFAPGWFGYEMITSFAALARRGLIAQGRYDALLAALQRLADSHEYFYSVTLFIYVGTKI